MMESVSEMGMLNIEKEPLSENVSTEVDSAHAPNCQETDEYMNYYTQCGGVISKHRNRLFQCLKRKKSIVKKSSCIVLMSAYLAYFGYCMHHSFGDEGSLRLLFVTILVLLVIARKAFPSAGDKCSRKCTQLKIWSSVKAAKVVKWSLYVLLVIFVAVYLGLDVLSTHPDNLIPLAGLVVFVFVGFIMSEHPDRVNWHAVFWGVGTQFIFAILILRTEFGFNTVLWLSQRFSEYFQHVQKGCAFIFGKNFAEHKFAFSVMPVIVFISASIRMLYHYGILQSIVAKFGWFLSFCLGTSAIESVSTVLSIFMGPPEVPLAVKPFLSRLTPSEMHAVMAASFASIAGSSYGILTAFGAPGNHLLTASVMSAPAALAMSKLIVPETQLTKIQPQDAYTVPMKKYRNVIEAVSAGAVDAIQLVGTIIVNQLVFMGMIEFIDTGLQWFGDRAGVHGVSFSLLCSYLFYPLCFLMGFPSQDVMKIGELMGIKIFANSALGYYHFGQLIGNRKSLDAYIQQTNGSWYWEDGNIILNSTNEILYDGTLTLRSEVIGTYAFCGQNHVAAIGVTMGALVALAPDQEQTVSRYVVLANISGHLACFMTACIAGMLFEG